MATPKNFYNTVDQKKLGIDEIPAIKAKIDSLEGLPEVTIVDAGKVMKVDSEGKWNLDKELPSVVASDKGKIMKVDRNGNWDASYGDTVAMNIRASQHTAVFYRSETMGNVSLSSIISMLSAGKNLLIYNMSTYEIYTPVKVTTNQLILQHIDGENKIIKICDFTSATGVYSEVPFEIAPSDTWGDITWNKELVEAWDFTKSLEGSEGDSFIITAGASRTDAGIVFDGTAPTVSCDLKNLISDWLEIGIHMECEYDNWSSGTVTQLSFFGCDGALFEMYNSAPYNQVFPRDFYTPTINQKMIFRDIYLDSYNGLYSFNRYMAGSGSTTSLFTKFNTQIRDSDKLFLLGGYNNYGTPPEGFTITKLEFYRRISGGET